MIATIGHLKKTKIKDPVCHLPYFILSFLLLLTAYLHFKAGQYNKQVIN